MPRASSYRLTSALVAAHAGGPVVALDIGAVGRTWTLHATRPGAELNARVFADVIGADGSAYPLDALDGPVLTRVGVVGPLEECAGYHDECGGWSDGHDAVTERMISALIEGDVLAVWRCPGGAVAGCQAGIDRVLAAKAQYGRRITSFAGELIASAAAWWALAISDEVWTNSAGVIGSLGARGCHASIAGALAQEGVVVEHFAWPDAGKVALAPELPLSEVGRARGNRDVTLAGEALAAGVLAGPLARRHGLTLEGIKAMSADAYTGETAVAMGLCSGIASLEDVETYALAIAGGEMTAMSTAAEDTAPPGDGDEAPAQEGKEPSSACASCASANEPNAKFCDQCGASMAARAVDDEEEPVPESKPMPPGGKAAVARMPAARPNATLAALAGLQDGASMPAIMSALARRNVAMSALATATGTTDPAAMVGGLEALVTDARAAGELRAERDTLRRRANAEERMSLLGKLQSAGVHARGELFVDVVENGKITGRKPAPLWSAGPNGRTLDNLRNYVALKLANAGPSAHTPRSPFEPDPKLMPDMAGADINESDRRLANGLGRDPAALAKSRNALFGPNSPNARNAQ